MKDVITQRYEFCTLASEKNANISALCRAFEISRQTGYKWLKRFKELGNDGLVDQSRRPHRSPLRTAASIEAEVLSLRSQYPYWSPRKLRRLLRDRLSASQLPSIITVARILKRRGMVASRKVSPTWPAVGRFERPRPNDLWQIDLKGPMRLSDGRNIYSVGIMDDHSRYLVGLRMIVGYSAQAVLDCWIDAASRHDLPESTPTDHGAQFRMVDEESSAFRVFLWACGVRHIQGRIAHPQTQGKIERLWRTLKLELLSRHNYGDLASWQSCFDKWRYVYNHIRPHQELGDEPPVSRYRNSDRAYVKPDRSARIGRTDSQYRIISSHGDISLGGVRLLVGRGYIGWTVEAQPQGNGCWHINFRHKFVKELMLTRSDSF